LNIGKEGEEGLYGKKGRREEMVEDIGRRREGRIEEEIGKGGKEDRTEE
jgi:hypothetical protein